MLLQVALVGRLEGANVAHVGDLTLWVVVQLVVLHTHFGGVAVVTLKFKTVFVSRGAKGPKVTIG